MSGTVPRKRWKQLARVARHERNPRKFIYLVKQLYDLLNYGEEAEDAEPRDVSRTGTGWTQAARPARRAKAA